MAVLIMTLWMLSCDSETISTTDPNEDDSLPFSTLKYVYQESGMERESDQLEHQGSFIAETREIEVEAGTTVEFTAIAEDEEGLRSNNIWALGTSYSQEELDNASFENADPAMARKESMVSLTYIAEAGKEVHFVAVAENYHHELSTSFSGKLIIKGKGDRAPLPASVQSTDITLQKNPNTQFFEAPGGFPLTGTEILGVAWIDGGEGDFISLVKQSSNADIEDPRRDMFQLIKGEENRVDFFNGPSVPEPWFGLIEGKKLENTSQPFTIRVYF
ncbi:MAG: hypothetical protein AAFY71_11105 [Bacteroidota bacterium]